MGGTKYGPKHRKYNVGTTNIPDDDQLESCGVISS